MTDAAPSGEVLAGLGIEHRLMPPKSPQTNGMAERFTDRFSDVLRTNRFEQRP